MTLQYKKVKQEIRKLKLQNDILEGSLIERESVIEILSNISEAVGGIFKDDKDQLEGFKDYINSLIEESKVM